ncbi:hypothetical protein JB92DRAFT_2934452 [Gautieria morchelliformis]|nr:hypothetical protein JB92DRAFT_2934452 [Gautieria morchelliformis]
MLLIPFAMLGIYALALLKFLRSLPITSFINPENPGASFYLHPAAGTARINGKFIQLPSRTTSQAPAHVYELGHPVAGLALNFATTPVPSRSGTGGLCHGTIRRKVDPGRERDPRQGPRLRARFRWGSRRGTWLQLICCADPMHESQLRRQTNKRRGLA